MIQGGTVISGLTGEITLPSNSAISGGSTMSQRLSSVSINVGQSLADISAYGGPDWVSRIGLTNDLTGSAAGFVTGGSSDFSPFGYTGNPSSPPTGFDKNGQTMTIVFKSGCQITFKCVIGNVRIIGSFEGLDLVTFDWARGDEATAPNVSWS